MADQVTVDDDEQEKLAEGLPDGSEINASMPDMQLPAAAAPVPVMSPDNHIMEYAKQLQEDKATEAPPALQAVDQKEAIDNAALRDLAQKKLAEMNKPGTDVSDTMPTASPVVPRLSADLQAQHATVVGANNQASQLTGQARKAQEGGLSKEAEEIGKQGEEEAKIYEQAAQGERDAVEYFKQAQAEGDKQAALADQWFQKNYQERQAVIQKLSAPATWGDVGVSKLGGSIAIILGGLATHGQGENPGVARINQLITQRTQALMAQENALNDQQKNIQDYAVFGHNLRQQRYNEGMTIRAALRSKAISELSAAAARYQGPVAKARAQQAIAQLQAQQANEDNTRNQFNAADGTRRSLEIEKAEEYRDKLDAVQQAKQAANEKGQIRGFVGQVPDSAVHTKLSELNQGSRSAIQILHELKSRIDNGTLTPDDLSEDAGLIKFLQSALRQANGDSSRPGEIEQRAIKELLPSRFQRIAGRFGLSDLTGMNGKIDGLIDAIGDNMVTKTMTVPGLKPDLNDPFVADIAKRQTERAEADRARDVVKKGKEKK